MPKPHKQPEEALERDVHTAAERMGWALPQDDEAVHQAEQDMGDVALPEALRDPQAVLERPDAAPRPATLLFRQQSDIDAGLARAAREAGHLTPEIEQRMRRDREEAERETEADPQDQ
jgi:hypothetical protein